MIYDSIAAELPGMTDVFDDVLKSLRTESLTIKTELGTIHVCTSVAREDAPWSAVLHDGKFGFCSYGKSPLDAITALIRDISSNANSTFREYRQRADAKLFT